MHAELPRFTGSVEHALDDKGRLIVPARFRERLGAGLCPYDRPARSVPGAAIPAPPGSNFCTRLEAAPRKDEAFTTVRPSTLCPYRGGRVRCPGAPGHPRHAAHLCRHRTRGRFGRLADAGRNLGQGAICSPRGASGRGRRFHGRLGTLLMWGAHDARSGAVGTGLGVLGDRPDGIYVDATFGAGGHSTAILKRLAPAGRADRARCGSRSERAGAPPSTDPRLTFVRCELSRPRSACSSTVAMASVDGVLFDLGVSSMQFDDPERGFSLGRSAPLDMRMDPHGGRSAYDVLASASERELADIFFAYGEERSARRIAHAIVERRAAGSASDDHHRVRGARLRRLAPPGTPRAPASGDPRLSGVAHRRKRRARRAA